MSNALTLAKNLRAIASGMVMLRVSNGVTVSGSMLVKAAEAIEALHRPAASEEQKPVAWLHTNPKGINNLTRYRLTNNDKARGWVEVPLYTTPQPAVSPSATSNIKEALERTIKFIESHMHYSQPGLDRGEEPSDMFTHEALPVVVGLNAVLATLSPPAGEKRESIARLVDDLLQADFEFNNADKQHADIAYDNLKAARCALDKAIDNALASGLVQDEAPEPTPAMIDAGVAFALSVSLSGGYKWPQYIADLYKTMRAAAIRSGRDGGAES